MLDDCVWQSVHLVRMARRGAVQLWRAHNLRFKAGRMALPQEMNPGQGDESSELAQWPVEQYRTTYRQLHPPSSNTWTWHLSSWLAEKVPSFHLMVLQLETNWGVGSVLLLAHGSVCRILQSTHGRDHLCGKALVYCGCMSCQARCEWHGPATSGHIH